MSAISDMIAEASQTMLRQRMEAIERLLSDSGADPNRQQLSYYFESDMYAVTPIDSELSVEEARAYPHIEFGMIGKRL